MSFKNRLYPHLLPDDMPVWERYLAAYPNLYDVIEYDVQVGFGTPPPPDIPPEIEKDRRHLTRRRIDAVAHTGGWVTLIEITRLADLKAIGQLITYPILYRITYQPHKPIRMLLVAEKLNTDIDLVIPFLDVVTWLSPPPS